MGYVKAVFDSGAQRIVACISIIKPGARVFDTDAVPPVYISLAYFINTVVLEYVVVIADVYPGRVFGVA